jgi:mannose-6-phosphate isomerase
MEQEASALLGATANQYETFPWLLKFLDVYDWLSVQVHPDEARVRELWPGEGSKTEAWFVFDARPGSRIFAGLLPGVDEKTVRKALHEGTVADCLHSFQPRAGDFVFLPAGTVHAVGGGVVIAEIQQTSDATFRLFDWNRLSADGKPRQLHIEEAIASIHWDQGPVQPIRCASSGAPGQPTDEGANRQRLMSTRYFHLEYVRTAEPFRCAGRGRLELLVILNGNGRLIHSGVTENVQHGHVWVLPSAMPQSCINPEKPICALHCSLP